MLADNLSRFACVMEASHVSTNISPRTHLSSYLLHMSVTALLLMIKQQTALITQDVLI